MNFRIHVACVGLAAFAFSGLAAAQDVTGAGASFPAPLYARWASDYHKATGAKVNYQSVGSGAGIRQIDAKTVDFGASDMPLKDEELKAKGLVQFPTVIGGVIPVVNIQGVAPGQLRLNGAILAGIYLGKISKWSDAAIQALNPGLTLPDAAIAPVRRADGSGTTFIFTNYLSKASPEWKSNVGEGTAVSWKAGTGGKGNEGVASYVQRIKGSIGYVEYAYALQNRMASVQLKNRDGQFVAPGEISFKAAAANAKWEAAPGFYEILTDEPGKESWPISGATFILMHKMQENPDTAKEVLKFFDWAYTNGGKLAADLDYIPLPENVQSLIRKSWKKIHDTSGSPVVK